MTIARKMLIVGAAAAILSGCSIERESRAWKKGVLVAREKRTDRDIMRGLKDTDVRRFSRYFKSGLADSVEMTAISGSDTSRFRISKGMVPSGLEVEK